MTHSYQEQEAKRTLTGCIGRLRAANGWSQSQLGEWIGMTQPEVSQLLSEVGGRFSFERLFNALRAMGVSVKISLTEDSAASLLVDDLAAPHSVTVEKEGIKMIERDALLTAAKALDPIHREGYTARQLADWLNAHGFLTQKGEPWTPGQKLIPGDYAIRDGEIANPSAAEEPEHRYPRFLQQVSAPGSRPQRYKLRDGYKLP